MTEFDCVLYDIVTSTRLIHVNYHWGVFVRIFFFGSDTIWRYVVFVA